MSPFEQYGLYGTLLGGGAYLVAQFRRAQHLMKYAKLKDISPTEAELFGDMANVPPYQLQRAARFATRFRVQGVSVAASAPLLWLLWRASYKHKP